jgi:5-dehydro-2-deoxygluconokinase
MALAIDHRPLFEEMAARTGSGLERIGAFKRLAVEAAARVADGQPGFGVLVDDKHGREALFAASRHGLWVGRPLEEPGSRPLRFELGDDVGSRLIEWPVDHCVKCLCIYHPDDAADLKSEQLDRLRTVYDAARRIGRELLIEFIASKNGPLDDATVSRALAEVYARGIKPDWWKLEPQASPGAWRSIDETIRSNDRWCRGVVLLGLEAPTDVLTAAFATTRSVETVKGFAVGRTVFADVARSWFAGDLGDDEATDQIATRFAALTKSWTRLRQQRVA